MIPFPTPRPAESDRAPMIDSLTIENFRAFSHLHLKGCKTLNVVLGRNASGKTALLEAIFLALGSSPEVAQRMRGWRSLPIYSSLMPSMDREAWSDLFHDFDLTKTIKISLRGSSGHDRSLTITYGQTGFDLVPSGSDGSNTLAASPIKFEFRRPGQTKPQVARAVPLAGQLGYINADTQPTEVVFFASQVQLNAVELADRFSLISKERREASLVDLVCKEFDFIDSLNVLSTFGSPSLYARTKQSSSSSPIGLVSSGVFKIVSVLTSIAAYPGGVILLDEIENGVYYERYESLWRTIYELAKSNSVQIFASTHNAECLDALSRVSKDWQNDVSFIRFNDSDPRVEQFHGSTIFKAMNFGEVR